MGQRMEDMTDRQLLQAYAQGQDVRAFDVFVYRHEGALLSFAASYLRDEATAQEVVQEAFFRAARYPQRILEFTKAGTAAGERTWLFKVVRDLCVDGLRRRATERKALGELSRAAPRAVEAPEAAAEVRERHAEVLAAVDALAPRLRELLILKVREQKSYKEIAQITGLSVTNVGFLLHQAMKELGKRLRGIGDRG